MLPRNEILLCLLVFGILHVATGIKVYSKSHHFPKGFLHLEFEIFTNPGLVYGVCSETNDVEFEDHCTFGIEKKNSIDSPDHLRTCNVTIKSSSEKRPIANVVEIFALNDDKLVVVWEEVGNYHRIGIVNFNDCKLTAAKMDESIKMEYYSIRVLPENAIGLIFYSPKKNSDSRYCRMAFDDEGNVITPPHRWIGFHNTDALVHTTLNDSLVVEKTTSAQSGEVIRVSTMDVNGSMKTVKEYAADESDGWGVKKSISTTNRFITVCSAVDSIVSCGQFDKEGVIKFETNFGDKYFKTVAVHNLPNGGFLLLGVEEGSPEQNFFVTKVNDAGNRLGSLTVTQLKCEYGFRLKEMHFFENEKKELCLSRICDSRRVDDKVTLHVVCLDNKDFSI